MTEYRSLLLLAYVLQLMPGRWATYAGLQRALGIQTKRRVRALVKHAEERGYVRIKRAAFRPGGPKRSLVCPTRANSLLVATIFRGEQNAGLR